MPISSKDKQKFVLAYGFAYPVRVHTSSKPSGHFNWPVWWKEKYRAAQLEIKLTAQSTAPKLFDHPAMMPCLQLYMETSLCLLQRQNNTDYVHKKGSLLVLSVIKDEDYNALTLQMVTAQNNALHVYTFCLPA